MTRARKRTPGYGESGGPDPADYFRADWPRCAFWLYSKDCGECAQCKAMELFAALPSGAEVSLRADDRPGVRALAEAAGMPPDDARRTLTIRR